MQLKYKNKFHNFGIVIKVMTNFKNRYHNFFLNVLMIT